MFYLLSFLWFFRTIKIALFYLYLWQLKEYHIGRFLEHFRTEKGKKLIFNKITLLKLGLLFAFSFFIITEKQFIREGFLNFFFLGILISIYIVESVFIFKNFVQKKLKLPIWTKKTIFLASEILLIEIIILFVFLRYLTDIFHFAFWLLIFDIIAPKIFSFIILSLQPFAFLLKNRIIKKAKIKRLKYKDLIVIGITGSYGKTSTKEFLATILSEKFNVLKTQKHQNSEIGIAQCVLNDLKPKHQVFVVEMGAYGIGTIKLDCDIVRPKIGILTGINEQHLALFGSQGNIIKAKYELIENLPQDSVAIFNGDNKYCLELYKLTKISKKLYNINKLSPETMLKSDIWTENVKIEKKFISFKIKNQRGETAYFTINLLGSQNISNILAAIITAQELGMRLEEISEACLKIRPEQGAIKLIEGKDKINILDTSYSANPEGVIADLDYLKIYSGKKIIVMPCLIELGRASKEVHKRIGQKIAEVCDLAIITTQDRFEDIREEAVEKGMTKENIIFSEVLNDIINSIKFFSVPGDTVLIEGRVPKELIEMLRQ